MKHTGGGGGTAGPSDSSFLFSCHLLCYVEQSMEIQSLSFECFYIVQQATASYAAISDEMGQTVAWTRRVQVQRSFHPNLLYVLIFKPLQIMIINNVCTATSTTNYFRRKAETTYGTRDAVTSVTF